MMHLEYYFWPTITHNNSIFILIQQKPGFVRDQLLDNVYLSWSQTVFLNHKSNLMQFFPGDL